MESSLYRRIKELGEGSTGIVYLVEEAETGKLFVTKEILLRGYEVILLGINNFTVIYRSEEKRKITSSIYYIS